MSRVVGDYIFTSEFDPNTVTEDASTSFPVPPGYVGHLQTTALMFPVLNAAEQRLSWLKAFLSDTEGTQKFMLNDSRIFASYEIEGANVIGIIAWNLSYGLYNQMVYANGHIENDIRLIKDHILFHLDPNNTTQISFDDICIGFGRDSTAWNKYYLHTCFLEPIN